MLHSYSYDKATTRVSSGVCQEVFNTTFLCSCSEGWQGDHCQRLVDRCGNVTCENRGVCRSSTLGYRCECVGDGYSGQHCEITSSRTVTLHIISQSWAYIAIIAMAAVVLFIVTMDVLTYGFGIDPMHDEVRRRRQKTRLNNKKVKLVAHIGVRFVYVNAPIAAPCSDSAVTNS